MSDAINLDDLKIFECGESMHTAARTREEARAIYLTDFFGEEDDEIEEVNAAATIEYRDSVCDENAVVLFEKISYRDLVAYLADRGCTFPGVVCVSADHC